MVLFFFFFFLFLTGRDFHQLGNRKWGDLKMQIKRQKGSSAKKRKCAPSSIYGVTMLWTLFEICLSRIQINLA